MRTTDDFVVPDPPPWCSTDAHLRHGLSAPVSGMPPCADCLATCCWFVLLETGSLDTRDDLDWIAQHLDYDRVVVWLDPAGRYTLGAIAPCHLFDRRDCSCSVHDTARQPRLCRRFDASTCWYRNVLRDDRRWLLRIDGRRWPAFHERILLADDGSILSFLDRRSLRSTDRRYDVRATLELPLSDDMVSSPELRGDLLHFLSCYEGVRVARTPESWLMLLETHRDRAVPARSIESAGGLVRGYAACDVFEPDSATVADLVRQLGARVFDLMPDELREAACR